MNSNRSITLQEILVAMCFEQSIYSERKVRLNIFKELYDFGDITDRMLASLMDNGLAWPAPYDKEANSIAIALTDEGLKEAQKLIDSGIQVKKFSSRSDGTTLSDGSRYSTRIPPEDFQIPEDLIASEVSDNDEPDLLVEKINSIDWTGLGKSVSEDQIIAIRESANQLRVVIIQSQLDENTRQNALKRVDAIIALLEAPNIPFKEIVELLNSQYFAAFLAAMSLAQLIFGLAS